MSTRSGRLTGPQLALLRAIAANDVAHGDDGRLLFLSTGRPVKEPPLEALLRAGHVVGTFHMDGPPFCVTKAGRAYLTATVQEEDVKP